MTNLCGLQSQYFEWRVRILLVDLTFSQNSIFFGKV